MSRRIVRGLDLSLTGAGIAGAGWAQTLGSKGKRADTYAMRRVRLHRLADRIVEAVAPCDLAVVEGPSYGSRGAGTWDRAGLWWLVVDRLAALDIPVAVVTPTARAKYATGNGRAGKQAVVDAIGARYGVALRDDNQGDAYALLAMGHDWLGDPLAKAPAINRAALARVEWPDLLPPPAVQLGIEGADLPYPDTLPTGPRKRRRRTARPDAQPVAGPGQVDALALVREAA
ncbi:hypothetical protein [Streptomyces sp. RKAG293]|uniref:hypothetical protein n=1 Tax=Streptomyces sp. RKAG293 TaxID=2893403 RepID=UPI0020341A3C|nr:hypothetical protein [Streptomyces sp. RKAG293]MCM2420283.1 hypothetical protein [Streptomyces sp. RKAG293]